MDNHEIGVGEASIVDMTASQRALELRKFFEPFYPHPSSAFEGALTDTIHSDGALDAFSETVVWRLGGLRAMVSLVDRTTQYFLAGAKRPGHASTDELAVDRTWFGCNTVATPGGLCENTLAVDCSADKFSCFIVPDLLADPRFASLPVVDGTMTSYRFYAGAPVTTYHGVNIGSLFMFDDRPRPEGLTLDQRKFLFEVASNVMRHLETKREAAERRRVSLMSRGIARFLKATSHITEADLQTRRLERDTNRLTVGVSGAALSNQEGHDSSLRKEIPRDAATHNSSTNILDQIKMTLDHAAEILRDSLEIVSGGVVFFDTALGHRDTGVTNYFEIAEVDEPMHAESPFIRGKASPGQVRTFNDQYQPAKVLAVSVAESIHYNPSKNAPDGKTLMNLINLYPKGNIWYIDEGGFFSSIEQVDALNRKANPPLASLKLPADFTRQRKEADSLSKLFEKARQIVFLPLWDAGGNRWYAGCFVWSQLAVPVFTAASEIGYLSALTNSMMVEISRLEAITANKMKSDFISSISHEFRSPLHGILASTEFLRDSELDSMQAEFISTIQNCGSTLLDTINHVLDYSKINTFETKGRESGCPSNELYQTNNVALLCEEIVYGMMAAKEFQGMSDSISLRRPSIRHDHSHEPNVHIILDFEHRDWDYEVQSGALRRIIMNIFGNAHKYTDSGYILVQLRVREDESQDLYAATGLRQTLVLKIIDSGRGMSSEYMERKLYTPFAQEDSFAPGIGLGLSIVWSIVNQLGGMIHIRSEIGHGTEVEVTLPLSRRDAKLECGGAKATLDVQNSIESVRNIASGRSVAIVRNISPENDDIPYVRKGWQCIEDYFSTWFGFTVLELEGHDTSVKPDLIITDKLAADFTSPLPLGIDTSRVLLVREGMTCIQERKSIIQKRSLESIWRPMGPYKLARAVLTLFKEQPVESAIISPTSLSAVSEILGLSSVPSPSSASSTSPAAVDLGQSDVSKLSGNRSEKAVTFNLKWPEAWHLDPPKPTNTEAIISPPTVPADLGASELPRSIEIFTSATISPEQPPLPPPPFSPSILSTDPTVEAPLYILAVDDNMLNLQLLHRYLTKRSQDVVLTAHNGIEAVSAVRSAGVPFDIILMDISMPEMDGFEATRLIRLHELSLRHREVSEVDPIPQPFDAFEGAEINTETSGEHRENTDSEGGGVHKRGYEQAHAYIVALTGLASRRDRDEAEKSGFDEFLTKPISFGKIGELLQRLSGEKLRRSDETRHLA